MTRKFGPLLVVFLCVLLVVWGVNTIPIILWDESLYSVNAIEMLHSGIFSIHYFDGAVDFYNLKPPFFTQLRALSFYFFGYDYWVHRLPSILFSTATLVLLYVAALRSNKHKWWAVLAVVFLTIAPGYNTLHVAKGGEYDAVLAFFMLAYSLCFLKALSSNLLKWKAGTILFMGLAFYTKSIAGWFFVPGMLICILQYRRTWFVQKQSWLLVFMLLLFPMVYFGYLYLSVPGYLESIYQHHFTRFGNTLNDHPLPWYHYLKSPSVIPYYLPSLMLTIWLKYKGVSLPKWSVQGQILVLGHLILISVSATKHGFYTAAIFPVASLVLSFLVQQWVQQWVQHMVLPSVRKTAKIAVIVFSIISLHFTFAKANNYIRYYNRSFPLEYCRQLLRGNLLMKPSMSEVNYGEDARIYYNETRHWFNDSLPSKLVVFAKDLHVPNSDGYNPLLMFYVDYWRLEKNILVDLAVDITEVEVGDTVLCSEPEKVLLLKNNFQVMVLKQSEHCFLFHVTGVQNQKSL